MTARNLSTLLQRIRRGERADGDLVTAEVWNSAHDAHDARLDVMMRDEGPGGVVRGLRVKHTNDAGMIVVSPGIAIDGVGRWLVLEDHVRYRYALAEGPVRIWLYASPADRARDGITRPTLLANVSKPDPGAIEIARLIPPRSQYDAVRVDESCRLELDLGRRDLFRVSVCHFGSRAAQPTLPGVNRLAESLRWRRGLRVLVEQVDMDRASTVDTMDEPDHFSLFGPAPGVADYATPPDLVYLVFHAAVAPQQRVLNGVKKYLDDAQHIGTVFMEFAAGINVEPIVTAIARSAGGTLTPVEASTQLGQMPNWLGDWPQGASTAAPRVRMLARALGEGGAPEQMTYPARRSHLIVSDNRYGWLWNGEQDQGVPTPGQVREAREFGENLIALAAGERRHD